MVEVPEHLLKRSKERRAALGLGGDEAPSSGETGEGAGKPAEAAPAAPPPSKPAPPPEPKAPEPPKPDPIYIQAAKQRQRLPWWSLPVFVAIPLWAWIFLRTLSPAEVEADPRSVGESLYADKCATCHQPTGEGSGTNPALTEVGETWPDFRDHMMWVRTGGQDWPSETYGESGKENTHTMPPFDLTDEELASVVLYERETFGEVEASDDEIGTMPDGEPLTEAHLEQIAAGELTFADVGVGRLSEEAGFTEDDLAAAG